jgi:MFS transporter, MHS family, shikimate and dehydroshikimate transport protein
MSLSSSSSTRRRVGWSSFIGTTIEYYDFLLFAAAATVVFDRLFFASLSPALGTIAALTTLAVGWFARLAGGVLFAHFGDRYGRRSVLVATMLLMGVSSGAIGLLPTHDQIGPAAAIALVVLRVLQGLAVGGEYGGAVLMTAEHARPGRRGLATSVVSMVAPAGAALATGVLALVTLLPEDDLLDWGWRLPFLAGFGLLGLGMYLRSRVPESPEFLVRRRPEQRTGAPITRLLRSHRRRVALGVAVGVGPFVGQGVMYFFLTSYAVRVGFDRSTVLLTVTTATVLTVLTTPLFALLSDRIGRRPVARYAALATALVVFPFFWLVGTGDPVVLLMTVCCYTALIMAAGVTVVPVLLSELFDTDVRYSGMSVSYQVAQMLGSGLSPVVAAAMIAAFGGGTRFEPAAVLVVIVALGSAWAVRKLPPPAVVATAVTIGDVPPVERIPVA